MDNWEEAEKIGKINLLIYDAINIEKNVEILLGTKDKIESLNSKATMQFCYLENDIEIISEKIKNFGKILYNNYKYIFKQFPIDNDENKKFIISGKKQNIITKKGPNFVWTGTTCTQELQNVVQYKWNIKIKKSETKQIMVGVASIDFNIQKIDISDFAINTCEWYFYLNIIRSRISLYTVLNVYLKKNYCIYNYCYFYLYYSKFEL